MIVVPNVGSYPHPVDNLWKTMVRFWEMRNRPNLPNLPTGNLRGSARRVRKAWTRTGIIPNLASSCWTRENGNDSENHSCFEHPGREWKNENDNRNHSKPGGEGWMDYYAAQFPILPRLFLRGETHEPVGGRVVFRLQFWVFCRRLLVFSLFQ